MGEHSWIEFVCKVDGCDDHQKRLALTELATLRADLARVTAERDATQRGMRILAESAVDTEEKLAAQVRALQTVARAAVAWVRTSPRVTDEHGLNLVAVLSDFDPSMLEEVDGG